MATNQKDINIQNIENLIVLQEGCETLNTKKTDALKDYPDGTKTGAHTYGANGNVLVGYGVKDAGVFYSHIKGLMVDATTDKIIEYKYDDDGTGGIETRTPLALSTDLDNKVDKIYQGTTSKGNIGYNGEGSPQIGNTGASLIDGAINHSNYYINGDSSIHYLNTYTNEADDLTSRSNGYFSLDAVNGVIGFTKTFSDGITPNIEKIFATLNDLNRYTGRGFVNLTQRALFDLHPEWFAINSDGTEWRVRSDSPYNFTSANFLLSADGVSYIYADEQSFRLPTDGSKDNKVIYEVIPTGYFTSSLANLKEKLNK